MDLLSALHDQGDQGSVYNGDFDGWLSWTVDEVGHYHELTITFRPYDCEKDDAGEPQTERYTLGRVR